MRLATYTAEGQPASKETQHLAHGMRPCRRQGCKCAPLPARGFARGEAGVRGSSLPYLITGCVSTTARNCMGKKAKPSMIEGVAGGLRVYYPDERIAPKICDRTSMPRASCRCESCRRLRRRKHGARCSCYVCYSDRMGEFIDDLGRRTQAGRWLWFLTLTFRTPSFPWARGFPVEQPEPCSDLVGHFFDRMISWIEHQVHVRVEYFTADQFGEQGGRLHQHCGLSWCGLFEYRWKDLQEMLWKDAGFNRILRWEREAGFYIGRYIGRDAYRCHWDFRVGSDPVRAPALVGRRVVVESRTPDDSSRAYRQTFGRLHR